MFAGEDPARNESIERVDVECDDEAVPQSPREVVNQAAATRAQHEDAARRMTAQDVDDGGERRIVLLLAPGPVAMQVDVVRGEALRARDARAECAMQLGRGRARGAERREQRRQPACVVLERRGLQLQPVARAHVETRALERRAQRRSLAREIRQQRLQALAPFGQRLVGSREEPRDTVEHGVARVAASTAPGVVVARQSRPAAQAGQRSSVAQVGCGRSRGGLRRSR